MNNYDTFIKRKAKEDPIEVPNDVTTQIEQTLASLPPQNPYLIKAKAKVLPKIALTAACFSFIFLFVMPNCSTVYAKALETIPVIGDIVKVITIRNYFYSDQNHEMNITVPKIVTEPNEAIDYINQDIDILTKILADKFYNELEEYGYDSYSSILSNYEVITNNETWFTLKLYIQESAGSSNTYYKYYHIDKKNVKIVNLGDLSSNEEFLETLEKEIKHQMKEIMSSNSEKHYWINDTEIGQDFVKLTPTQNFYWNIDGNLTIVFNKYEVAPGSMGTPEFTIDKNLIQTMLKPEYQ